MSLSSGLKDHTTFHITKHLANPSNFLRAITSIGITIPAIYYLLQPQLNASNHGGGHGHGGHDEHGAESHEEGHSDESEDSGEHKSSEPADAEEQGKDEGQEGKKEDESTQDQAPSSEDSDDNSEGQPTPPTSDDSDSDSDTEVANTAHEKEGGANVPGVRFKGAMSGGTKEGEQGDTRKHIPDAKGFNKKRIESHSAIRLGEADQEHQSADNQDLVSLRSSGIPFSPQDLPHHHHGPCYTRVSSSLLLFHASHPNIL